MYTGFELSFKRLSACFFICVSLFACYQNPIKLKNTPIKASTNDSIKPLMERLHKKDSLTKLIVKHDVGYFETYESLPKLKFEEVAVSEFNRCKQSFILNHPKLKTDGKNFYVKTSSQTFKFDLYKDHGEPTGYQGHEYAGYYPSLKLHAIIENYTAEHMGFGQLLLVDSITDHRYSLISFGDGSVELPIPSIHREFMVYYYNYEYEQKHAAIAVLKINSKDNPESYLQEYASFDSENFAVEEIVWLNDKTFYVKGYEQIYQDGQWVKVYSYHKTSFK